MVLSLLQLMLWQRLCAKISSRKCSSVDSSIVPSAKDETSGTSSPDWVFRIDIPMSQFGKSYTSFADAHTIPRLHGLTDYSA